MTHGDRYYSIYRMLEDTELTVEPVAAPAFAGLVAVQGRGAVTALALAALTGGEPLLLLSGPISRDTAAAAARGAGVRAERLLLHADAPPSERAAARVHSDARLAAAAALAAMAPSVIEWTSGRAPLGGAFAPFDGEPFLLGRVTHEGALRALLLAHDGRACRATAAAQIARMTTTACLTLAGPGQERPRSGLPDGRATPPPDVPQNLPPDADDVAARRGRALAHAALSALETLPPPGSALTFEGVVESGAPLAVWRPRPTAVSQRLDLRAERDAVRWHVGDALFETRAPGCVRALLDAA